MQCKPLTAHCSSACAVQIQVNAAGWAMSPALFALRYLDSELLSLLLLADMDVRQAWLEDPSGRRLAHCPLVAAVERRDLALPERTALIKALISLGADPRDRWALRLLRAPAVLDT